MSPAGLVRPDDRSLFIHSQWRCSSTYFWIRAGAAGFHAYNEPLHESLHNGRFVDLLRDLSDEARTLRHPTIPGGAYFREFSGSGPAPAYAPELPYADAVVVSRMQRDRLHAYFASLLARSATPCAFCCTRTSFRIDALREILPATHLYLLRDPFSQWTSYTSWGAENDYFVHSTLEIAGRGRETPLFRPLRELVDVPDLGGDLRDPFAYRRLLSRFTREQRWTVFLYAWCLGLLCGARFADFVLDLDLLSASAAHRGATMRALAQQGAPLDLSDLQTPRHGAPDETDPAWRAVTAQVREAFRDDVREARNRLAGQSIERTKTAWLDAG